MILRCAIYARYSSDKQSPTSIDDQVRKCREFADRTGWKVLTDHIYSDEAISGAGANRPALTRLLAAAGCSPRPFDVILLDDTSRLSRNLGDAVRFYERLNFLGIRVVAVGQGIDTENDQAEVLVAVHGLVDSLYLKELGKKTHRGLEGLALKGLHTGGRCFGYVSETGPGGIRLRVNEQEAAIVRRIFELSAAGKSLKGIAKLLNGEGVTPPRPRAGRAYGTWAPSCIHAMLRRELYAGRVVWNRSRFVKSPGTNKRLRRARPEAEWSVVTVPELRIVPGELWDRVRDRLAWVKETFGQASAPGLLKRPRSASSPYLFSGFLRCGVCGANLVIVSGRGKHGHPSYGCPQNFYRGACANGLKERHDFVEDRLLVGLQGQVLRPDVIDYAIEEFGRQLRAALANVSDDLSRMRERKQALELEMKRLAEAVAASGHSPALLEALAERERELRAITERLLASGSASVQVRIDEIRKYVTSQIAGIRGLLNSDVETARAELGRHVQEIRMVPNPAAKRPYYVAVGEWDLLGRRADPSGAMIQGEMRDSLVAGGGFEPPTFGL